MSKIIGIDQILIYIARCDPCFVCTEQETVTWLTCINNLLYIHKC